VSDPTDIQFLSTEELDAAVVADKQRRTVTLEVSTAVGGKVGPFLDIVERVAHAMELEMTLISPGYVRTFYGWEEDIWHAE
jgi:ribosome maturation factor RimP